MGFEPKPGGPQEGPKGVPSPGPPGARAPPLSGGCTPLCQALATVAAEWRSGAIFYEDRSKGSEAIFTK